MEVMEEVEGERPVPPERLVAVEWPDRPVEEGAREEESKEASALASKLSVSAREGPEMDRPEVPGERPEVPDENRLLWSRSATVCGVETSDSPPTLAAIDCLLFLAPAGEAADAPPSEEAPRSNPGVESWGDSRVDCRDFLGRGVVATEGAAVVREETDFSPEND